MNQRQRKAPTAHARPSRPSLHKRVHSYSQIQSHGHVHNASSKAGSALSRKEEVEVAFPDDAEEAGMASFLQFCTTCEKQISSPGNMLYCSTACRKKDALRPPSIHTVHSPAANVPSASSYFDSPPPEIIPQRSPTVVRPASLTFSDSASSDPGSPSKEHRGSYGRHDTEAARYLGQFYSQSYVADSIPNRRPMMNRASTGTDLPSLTHTPSSSVGTVESTASYRPLPLRHNALNGHASTRSVDLVTPAYPKTTSSSPHEDHDASMKSSASTLTSFHVAEGGDMSYNRRKRSSIYHNPTGGDLKQLFSHEAMQAPPKKDTT